MLSNDVSKYLCHKLHLAEVSVHYKNPRLKAAISWAQSMILFLKYRSSNTSERDLAVMIRQAKHYLFDLLPNDRNKSYRSSVDNCNRIINRCSEILQPK